MRDQYLPPQVMQVGSVEDLTLASGTGALVDICITVGGGRITVGLGVLDGSVCPAGTTPAS
jgi:hypothetical protein